MLTFKLFIVERNPSSYWSIEAGSGVWMFFKSAISSSSISACISNATQVVRIVFSASRRSMSPVSIVMHFNRSLSRETFREAGDGRSVGTSINKVELMVGLRWVISGDELGVKQETCHHDFYTGGMWLSTQVWHLLAVALYLCTLQNE